MKQKLQKSNKYLIISVVLLAVFFIFNSFYSISVPISGDEAYHWEWSRHLDFGYYDHPPMIGWFIAFTRAIGRIIGGPELFWTRLPALLSVTGIMIIVFKLVTQITGRQKLGFFALLMMMVTPLFSFGSNLVTTDQPLLLFWGLTFYFVYQVLFENKKNYWYFAGITMGLAFLSKFISILFLPGIFFFLLVSKEDRHWLARKEPYLALILTFIIYLPNLIWNATHDWVTFLFNLSSRHQAGFSLKVFANSILAQVAIVGPIIFFLLLLSLVYAGWQGLIKRDRKALFLFSISASVFVFFFAISLFREVGAHWPAVGYISLFITFIYIFKDIFNQKKSKVILKWVFYLGISLSLVMTITIHLLPVAAHQLPEKINLMGNEIEIDHRDLGPLYGWQEMGWHLEKLQDETEENLFFMSPSYAFSSMLSFNTPGQPFVRVYGSNSVYGQNYKYWNNFQQLKGRDAIFTYKYPLDSYVDKLNESFANVEELSPVIIYDPKDRQVRTIYYIYCQDFKGE